MNKNIPNGPLASSGLFSSHEKQTYLLPQLPQAMAQDSVGMDAETFQPSAHRVLENEYTNLGNFTLIWWEIRRSWLINEERKDGVSVKTEALLAASVMIVLKVCGANDAGCSLSLWLLLDAHSLVVNIVKKRKKKGT